MAGTILVAWATRYGSTREVAEAAAETLRDHGFTVEVAAAKDAVVGDGHDGVLLATPFYMGPCYRTRPASSSTAAPRWSACRSRSSPVAR